MRSNARITVAAIGYRIADAEERDLCYYGDDTFGPHLVRSLGMRDIRGEIRFQHESPTWTDRKSAARELHREVTAMRTHINRS